MWGASAHSDPTPGDSSQAVLLPPYATTTICTMELVSKKGRRVAAHLFFRSSDEFYENEEETQLKKRDAE